jgi:hypothetical protein
VGRPVEPDPGQLVLDRPAVGVGQLVRVVERDPVRPEVTAEPSMSVPNRTPSSSVKNPTSTSRRVWIPKSFSVRITSIPPSTPRVPSNAPPVATVSMCEPMSTQGSERSRPGRVA